MRMIVVYGVKLKNCLLWKIEKFIRRLHQRPWRASTCEQIMREITNGDRGCANPREHLLH